MKRTSITKTGYCHNIQRFVLCNLYQNLALRNQHYHNIFRNFIIFVVIEWNIITS